MIKTSTLVHDASHEGKPHHHVEGQLFIIKKGLMVLQTDEGRYLMPPLRAGWIPPLHQHNAKTYGPLNGEIFYLSSKLCKMLPSKLCIFTPNPLLVQIMMRCVSWQNKDLSADQKRLIQVMVDELATLKPEPLCLPMPRDLRLEKMTAFFIANPASNKTLSMWAIDANMTTRTFTRRFQLETGMSFAKWRQLVRIMKALEYLAKGKSVTWVSLTLGYESVSAFIKVFRNLLGETPAKSFSHQKSSNIKL
jgi:AraC-like DNA-binding protein